MNPKILLLIRKFKKETKKYLDIFNDQLTFLIWDMDLPETNPDMIVGKNGKRLLNEKSYNIIQFGDLIS